MCSALMPDVTLVAMTQHPVQEFSETPGVVIMIILDETLQEEDSDTRKEGQGKATDGTKIGGEMGQHGERRKTY